MRHCPPLRGQNQQFLKNAKMSFDNLNRQELRQSFSNAVTVSPILQAHTVLEVYRQSAASHSWPTVKHNTRVFNTMPLTYSKFYRMHRII